MWTSQKATSIKTEFEISSNGVQKSIFVENKLPTK